MAEITTTQAFSDGDTVTATKLNNITANAAIQTEAITNRSAETTVDQANDLLLMYDASATSLKKVAVSNIIKAGTASNFPVTGNATVGGTLGVTGASTLSSTLGVSDTISATKSTGTGLAVTNNATIGGTLAVTGAITASSTVNGTTIPTSKTLVTIDDTQTLTGKTVNLSSNTLAGTLAQFNTSCSDADFASLAGSETLTNKTLTSPVISGGTINNAAIGGTTAAAGSFTTLSATSPITTQAGTASAPAIVPTGDTNTGIFFPAADTIAFSEGGTEGMRIDSSGNVGIGNTSPATRLHVKTTSAETLRLERDGIAGQISSLSLIDGGGTSCRITSAGGVLTLDTNGGNERLRIDSSGRVGIGTATLANYRFSIAGDSSSVAVGMRLVDENASGKTYSLRSDVGSFVIQDITGSAERLRIDSSGNVGIGTTSPTDTLSIVGSSPTSLLKANSTGGPHSIFQNSGGVFYVGRNDSSGNFFATDSYANIIFGSGSRPIVFGTNLTERLRITSGGNVLVGTTADEDHKICVNHSHPTSGGGGIRINQTVTGTGRAIQFVYQTSTQVGSITTTASATAYNTSSDYRLKTNLEPISDGIDRLKQLPVYRFNWIADESGNKVDGFVAHEAQAIVPECVTGEKDAVDADGKPIYQGIDQSKIVPLLTAALKDAIAKIETLESRIAALEAA